MPLVWYFAVLGVNTPFKFAIFVREGAAPLPGIKGDRDSDRPWGQEVSQKQSENDKKEKIIISRNLERACQQNSGIEL